MIRGSKSGILSPYASICSKGLFYRILDDNIITIIVSVVFIGVFTYDVYLHCIIETTTTRTVQS